MSEQLIGPTTDFVDDDRKIVDVAGREVVVLRVEGKFHAFENRCLHQGGPVAEGKVMGRVEAVLDEQRRLVCERFAEDLQIICPWHGWAYELETGVCAADSRRRLRKFPVNVRDGMVYVDV